jgi:hypothetical protein
MWCGWLTEPWLVVAALATVLRVLVGAMLGILLRSEDGATAGQAAPLNCLSTSRRSRAGVDLSATPGLKTIPV